MPRGMHYAPRRRPVQVMPVEVAVALTALWRPSPAHAVTMTACLYGTWLLVGLLVVRTTTSHG